jgi:hypothetical protein
MRDVEISWLIVELGLSTGSFKSCAYAACAMMNVQTARSRPLMIVLWENVKNVCGDLAKLRQVSWHGLYVLYIVSTWRSDPYILGHIFLS